jgi:hypothetical protein
MSAEQTDRVSDLIRVVERSMDDSPSSLPRVVLDYPGYSVAEYRIFANKLMSESSIQNYLEIGVWQGSTAIPALYNNHHKIQHWFIDNWALFGGPKDAFVKNFTDIVGVSPNIMNEDCFAIDPIQKGISNVDVYFYDGEHTQEDQFKALVHYYPSMSDTFIYIVDDWNWVEQVQQGTMRAINHLNLKVHKQWIRTWWNGMGIFVMSKFKD